MVLKSQKIDVTDRVIGKLKNGELELFLENQLIGKLKLPLQSQYELEHHFEAENQKLYQHITVTDQPDAKYTDCEDGGWC